MDIKKAWKSTSKNKEPTGYKRKGTFRDISLCGWPPDFIDEFDLVCQQRRICRSRLYEEMRESLNFTPVDHLNGAPTFDPDGLTQRFSSFELGIRDR